MPEPQEYDPSEHVFGCGIDHDPTITDCYTRDDWLADQADRRYDEIKDGER